jgi:hypothetical protein
MSNENLRAQMGKRGREIYLENFTLQHFYKNMNEVFKSI